MQNSLHWKPTCVGKAAGILWWVRLKLLGNSRSTLKHHHGLRASGWSSGWLTTTEPSWLHGRRKRLLARAQAASCDFWFRSLTHLSSWAACCCWLALGSGWAESLLTLLSWARCCSWLAAGKQPTGSSTARGFAEQDEKEMVFLAVVGLHLTVLKLMHLHWVEALCSLRWLSKFLNLSCRKNFCSVTSWYENKFVNLLSGERGSSFWTAS